MRTQFFSVFLVGSLFVGCGGKDQTAPPEEEGKESKCVTAADCQNDSYCDGEEACEPDSKDADAKGCVPGAPVLCDTGLECSEKTEDCEEIDCDRDKDNSDGPQCGGPDCNDDPEQGGAAQSPAYEEVCDDEGIDEDCDPKTFSAPGKSDGDVDDDGYISVNCFNPKENPKDGVNSGDDCDDGNPRVFPNATEICDHHDNNCDGEVDEGPEDGTTLQVTRYADPDGDGYGGVSDDSGGVLDGAELVCIQDSGYVDRYPVDTDESVVADCGPEDIRVSPGHPEIRDGKDNDCDGEIDNNVVPILWYEDKDHDGYGDPNGETRVSVFEASGEWSPFPSDCDDSNSEIHPAQAERCDGKDNDCDPNTFFVFPGGELEDADRDGFANALCADYCGDDCPVSYDCDDSSRYTYPGAAELCDQKDNDCDGEQETSDNLQNWFRDADADGYGSPEEQDIVVSCDEQPGYVLNGADCDDSNKAVSPRAFDNCQGLYNVDDNCDGSVDEGERDYAYFRDLDEDGYGSELVGFGCSIPQGFAPPGDCNEGDDSVYPGSTEICDDLIDQDCDGLLDCADPDCDGNSSCEEDWTIQGEPPSIVTIGTTFDLELSLASPAGDAAGRSILVSGPAGAYFPRGVVAADSDGKATITLGVGLELRDYEFTVQTAGSPNVLKFSVRGDRPGGDSVFSALGRPELVSEEFDGSFGPGAQIGSVNDIVFKSDGTAYLADSTLDLIWEVSTLGVVRPIAGQMGQSSNLGNGGPAIEASLANPLHLAYDEDDSLLYVKVATDQIRVIDFNSEPQPTIRDFAGGGSVAPTPQGVARNLVKLSGIEDIFLLEGELQVATSGEVVSFDDTMGTLRLEESTNCAGAVGLEFSNLTEATAGPNGIYFTADVCGSSFGTSERGLFLLRSDDSLQLLNHQSVANEAAGPLYLNPISSPHDLHFTPGGHLLISTDTGVWAVTPYSRTMDIFLAAGELDLTDEYRSRISATTTRANVVRTAPDGRLWIGENSVGGRVRQVWNPEYAFDSADVELAWTHSASEAVLPGMDTPLFAVLASSPQGGLDGAQVEFLVETGHAAEASLAWTAPSGSASHVGFAGVTPGTYSVSATLWALNGDALAVVETDYEVNRPSGLVTHYVNDSRTRPPATSSLSPFDDIRFAPDAVMRSINELASDGAGGLYVAPAPRAWKHLGATKENQVQGSIYHVDDQWMIERIVGTDRESPVDSPTGGDGAFALSVEMGSVTAMALDPVRQRLYFAHRASSNSQALPSEGEYLRYLDINTGKIGAAGGYPGAPFADSWLVSDVDYLEDQVFVTSSTAGLIRLDANDLSSHETLLIPGTAVGCSEGEWLGCPGTPDRNGTPTPGACDLLVTSSTEAYLAGWFCTDTQAVGLGIARVTMGASSASLELVSNDGTGALSLAEGGVAQEAARVVYSDTIRGLEEDPLRKGHLFFLDHVGLHELDVTDPASPTIRLRKASNNVGSLAASLASASIARSWDGAFLSDGSYVFGEYVQSSVLRWWRDDQNY